MEFISIKTNILRPPKDDLYTLLEATAMDVREGDIILVTSKVVAIHQGQTVRCDDKSKKRSLVLSEADYYIESTSRFAESPLAIKYNALLFGAGIDESNGDGYYVLLPKDPFKMAREIQSYFSKRFKVLRIGVVITDSHSLPLRRGCVGVSIGLSGFHPVNLHKGRKDLFGRELLISATNIADSLAAGSSAVCGEANESTPVTIVRGVPNVRFTDDDPRAEILMSPEDDIYYPLLKQFYE